MKLKIAFMYLDVSNLGDIVIYETARYIVEDILKKHNIKNYEIVPIDIGSFKGKNYKEYSTINRVAAGILRRIGKGKLIRKCPVLAKSILRKAWKFGIFYQYYAKNEKPKLEGADLIIFGGGGLIKFHQQNFHYFLDEVTGYADHYNIPVLLNSQGIEGYDAHSPECQILKEAINRECVKYISTRDDFAMLRNCYIDNPNIVIKGVCDPAFWSAETYRIQKKENSRKIIGLNVIRTKIFGAYMYKVSRNSLGELYHDLIIKLCKDGYSVDLFSNGVESDTDFMVWLLETYPDLQEKYHVTCSNPKTTRELVETLAGYERYMAVRLHAAIIGSVLGVPNISLVWNRKQILFGKEIGMRQNFITKEKFNADDIYKQLLDAKPYKMNEKYKMSVYENLEVQIMEQINKIEKR